MRVTDLATIRRQFASPIDHADEDVLFPMIAKSGAFIEGHFRLQNGQHAKYFLRFGQLAFKMADARRIAQLAHRAVGPLPPRSILLTAETSSRFAEAMKAETGCDVALTKVGDTRRPTAELHGGPIDRSRAILLAADVVHTGASIRPLIELARSTRPSWLRLVSFATLHPGGPRRMLTELDIEGACLLQARWETRSADQCELCESGEELLPAFEFI